MHIGFIVSGMGAVLAVTTGSNVPNNGTEIIHQEMLWKIEQLNLELIIQVCANPINIQYKEVYCIVILVIKKFHALRPMKEKGTEVRD